MPGKLALGNRDFAVTASPSRARAMSFMKLRGQREKEDQRPSRAVVLSLSDTVTL